MPTRKQNIEMQFLSNSHRNKREFHVNVRNTSLALFSLKPWKILELCRHETRSISLSSNKIKDEYWINKTHSIFVHKILVDASTFHRFDWIDSTNHFDVVEAEVYYWILVEIVVRFVKLLFHVEEPRLRSNSEKISFEKRKNSFRSMIYRSVSICESCWHFCTKQFVF